MATLRLVIKYWGILGRVGQMLAEARGVLSMVRVDPEIAVRLTALVIEVAKAKADHEISGDEKSLLMERYWAVLDSVTIDDNAGGEPNR
jgi:hypothetical protein